MNWNKKLEYFWTYYKFPLLLTVAAVIVVSYLGYAKLTEKDMAFQALLFDIHTNVSGEELEKEFAEYASIDRKIKDVEITENLLLADGTSNYAMTSQAKFYALIGTEDLDAVVMLQDNFINYAKADAFLNLREVFSDEELQKFPELYQWEDGRIIGVYAEQLPKVQAIGGYGNEGDRAIVGIIYNTQHLDAARQFMEYLNE